MKDPIQRYLDKRADLASRPLESGDTNDITAVVVIPALAEEDNLPHTLQSLAANPTDHLQQTLVIVVINNRAPDHAPPEDITNNQRTLQWLRTNPIPQLRLATIDASSPGRELTPKEGVGMARKIGMDHALHILHQNDLPQAPIICLDADTLVEPNYLQAIAHHFAQPHAWAAVIDYAHRIEGSDAQQRAIADYEAFLRYDYEAFLRYHEAGLRYAASPYAFHTIGSTMACTARAYAAISGMNRRQAGEDFYFLQELAKTGRVDNIHATTVHPSSRISTRVPFGTGKRMDQLMNAPDQPFLAYHPHTYEILRQWLDVVAQSCGTAAPGCNESNPSVIARSAATRQSNHPQDPSPKSDDSTSANKPIPPLRGDQGGCSTSVAAGSPDPGAPPTPQGSPAAPEALLTHAQTIHPQLAAYLEQENFQRNWTRLQQNAPNPHALLQQFHRWFDALKTLRLIHHLRDTAYPDVELQEALLSFSKKRK